jgi:hypothetical protein
LRQPQPVQNAYAAIVSSQVQLIKILNIEIAELGQVVSSHFGRHRNVEHYLSQPGIGPMLGARILGEFGDRAGTSPITRASGSRRILLARYGRNPAQCTNGRFCAMRGSPGARFYYQSLRERGHRPPSRPAPTRQPRRLASSTAASKPAPPTTRPPPGCI